MLIGGLLQQLLFAAIAFSSLVGSVLMHRVPLGDGASEVRVDERPLVAVSGPSFQRFPGWSNDRFR